MKASFAGHVVAIVLIAGMDGIGAAPGPDAGAVQGPAQNAGSAITPCDELLPPLRVVLKTVGEGQFKVGPNSCSMTESTLTVDGRKYIRIDLGLDGNVDGFVSTNPDGDYRGYLTNAPEFVFPQTDDEGPIVIAIATYRKAQGAAMSVFYPADRNAWNGKMWVTAHGASGGIDIPWNKFDPAISGYDRQMLSRGYALVKTRRTANADGFTRSPNQPPTGITAALETDKAFDNAGFNDTARYVMDFTIVAENLIQRRLGRAPARTYFYGHSAGGRMGRGINYVPGLNKGPDGKPLYDGIFVDDSGAGTWLPVRMKDGKDVQFASEADRAAMVPQLEVVHQMYNNIWETDRALGVSRSYLENKRTNARIMRDKGLTPKFRAYEVRSISHSAGGPGLDVAPLFGNLFDLLDAWADKGVEPPPTRSDWKELGDVDKDGVIENPGISLPEISCPLGVYYPTWVESGSILFAPFTGEGLEPLDQNNVFIDMNRNGSWDYRETPTEAWRRLGLLQPGEELTRDKYVACVQAAAERLAADRFLSKDDVARYVERARTADLQPKEVPSANPRTDANQR
jgi:hypothetical protein